ncbi:MAG TPA: class II aldolase/adducin family protein [Gammaproteobacteria bacterium]|nr:class II aldolase/adducin family protein [Gammaproteobacteria bacterium]
MDSLNRYCARIGSDPSLVQGAGGNVSWKDGDKLHVKASGAWLADAEKKNIFVAVDLKEFRAQLAQGRFGAVPPVVDQSGLRPSIETVLHAIMPQKIVVHTHPVDALAHLVRCDCEEQLGRLLDQSVKWALVAYRKPGAELGVAVYDIVQQRHAAPPEAVFLANHGVIVAGNSLAEVEKTYAQLGKRLAVKPRDFRFSPSSEVPAQIREHGYKLPADESVQRLAFDPVCHKIISTRWALYPDHVVFLGGEPGLFETPEQFAGFCSRSERLPDYAIIPGYGTFISAGINQNKISMLKCFGDVLARVHDPDALCTLSKGDVHQLLNWEAEKYRSRIAK